jgi:GT2 family glycosyltransferase/SAM-dependent methyltransferase
MMLEWTGERYLPYIDPSICGAEIHYEHLHRYAFASQLVKGKKVLDLACGEGYGCFLLSKTARHVVGIDNNPQTVRHAAETYSQENIEFIVGSILEIPISGPKTFDVIVCFEAIEHITDHEILIAEVKRLLKDDGILIISTPNKKTYSDDPDYRNPFHEKELYFDEFDTLLKDNFLDVTFFGQRTINGSNIFPISSGEPQTCTEFLIDNVDDKFIFKNPSEKTPIYYIALASNVKKRDAPVSMSYLVDESNTQDSLFMDQVSTLDQTIKDQDLQIRGATDRISYLNEYITEKDQQVQGAADRISYLNEFMADKDQQIRGAVIEISRLNEIITVKDQEIQDLTVKIRSEEDEINARNIRIDEISERLVSLENENALLKNAVSYQFVMKFHQKFIERILPQTSRRRNIYDFGIQGGRIFVNEGFDNFICYYKEKKNLLIFPKPPKKAEVSIIIPVYNKFQYTLNCLKSILDTTTGSYEVIVVDDASTEPEAKNVKKIRNIRLIKNRRNLGFVGSCNRGAKISKGQYLLFLNNDTIATENWLTPLLELIKRGDVGGVGAKLIYPDGTLQEAGGIIWNDASGWNYGRGDDPKKPQYNYVRDVDYCSGAALLIKRDLFEQVGGFDERFKPGYYEDTDLCFSIRELGYRILYQPLSVVIHFEGISNGTDLSSGIKKYQEINRFKFFKKWENLLKEHYYPATPENVFNARIRTSGKKILVIDHYVPTWDKDAGSYRMYNFLKLLVELNHKVTFIGDNLLKLEPYSAELQQNGVEIIYQPAVQSIDDYLTDYGRFFDVVILSRPHIGLKHFRSVKEKCIHAKIIFDTVDLQYIREGRRGEIENDTTVMEEAAISKSNELFLATHSDMTLVVSQTEKELLLREDPHLHIAVLSTIHEVTPGTTPFNERKDLLFVGGFNHLPNVDAVKWFTKEIFPQIMKSIPDCRLFVIGSEVPKEIEQLASSNIIVVGYVKDLEPYFNKCRVFVAPLRFGAGVKGKISQSMSHGLPVITTTIGAEGMGLTDGKDIILADDAELFARLCVDTYFNEEKWNELSRNSMKRVQEHFSTTVWKSNISSFLDDLFVDIKK